MRINPDCPQRGPYEASEGIYHGHGQQELGGKNESPLDHSLKARVKFCLNDLTGWKSIC